MKENDWTPYLEPKEMQTAPIENENYPSSVAFSAINCIKAIWNKWENNCGNCSELVIECPECKEERICSNSDCDNGFCTN